MTKYIFTSVIDHLHLHRNGIVHIFYCNGTSEQEESNTYNINNTISEDNMQAAAIIKQKEKRLKRIRENKALIARRNYVAQLVRWYNNSPQFKAYARERMALYDRLKKEKENLFDKKYADNPAYRLVPTIVGAQSPIILDEGSPDDVVSTSNYEGSPSSIEDRKLPSTVQSMSCTADTPSSDDEVDYNKMPSPVQSMSMTPPLIQESPFYMDEAAKNREAKESAMKLMRPLTNEEQHIVDSAIHGIGPVAEVLVRQDADSVQRGSMQTLQPNTWLNDEIINYFLKNCLAKRDEKLCAKQPGRKRSHFFNSFFVQTMFDEKNLDPSLRGEYNYENVKRWGKKVPGKDIFNLRYIICPINIDNMHWTSAIIFMESKKIQYFDSMGDTEMSKLEGLLQYLKDEHKAKKGTELDVSEWKLVKCTLDTPRQRNGKFWGVLCMTCVSFDCHELTPIFFLHHYQHLPTIRI